MKKIKIRSIENLHAGDYIVVIDDAYQQEKQRPVSFEIEYQEGFYQREFIPVEVVSTSIPFILCKPIVETTFKTVTLDNRFITWTKLSAEFMREYYELNKISMPETLKNETEIQEEKESRKRCCPICTETMIERTGAVSGWSMVCKECEVQLVKLK